MSCMGVLSWNDTRRVADALLSILQAARCAACEEVLDDPTRGPVCAHCWTTVRTITPPVCHTCGDPLPSWRVISRHASACPRCRRAPRAVARSRAVGPYETSLRAIIHALKYDGRRSLALPLSALMRSHGQDVLVDADCVVPVPLHPGRRQTRGFNQAADLAAHLGLPVTPALRRVKRTPAQTGLPAARRHRNFRGAFALAPGHWGKWRVLVDARQSDRGQVRGAGRRCDHDRCDAGRVRPGVEAQRCSGSPCAHGGASRDATALTMSWATAAFDCSPSTHTQ